MRTQRPKVLAGFAGVREELPAAEQQLAVAELQALVAQAEAANPVETVHNDFSQASFTNSQVLGSGTMTVTNNYDK